MTHTQSGATTLGNRDGDAACIFLRSVRITTILKKRKSTLNRIETELHQLVCDQLGIRDLVAVNSEQLFGINLEAKLRPLLSLGDRAKHANPPITRDVVVARAKVGA